MTAITYSPLKSQKPNTAIAYLPLKSQEPNLDKKKFYLKELANQKNLEKLEFVEEVISKNLAWEQKKICHVLRELQSGDYLLVTKFSDLGWTYSEAFKVLLIASVREINILTVKGISGQKIVKFIFSLGNLY